ncbi:MAG: CehA/McbA family metallohydrolase [Armatimonadota bacterium]
MKYPKVERILSLDRAAAYPGKKMIDMVIFLGAFRGETVRLWLLTSAEEPSVRIDEREFEVSDEVGESTDGRRWLDLGVTGELNARFGQVRIEGMTIAEAQESKLLITRDVDYLPEGSLDEVEQMVFGISRKDAGRTAISPSRVEVGESASLEVTYTAGPQGLPPGAWVRFAAPRAFSAPQTAHPDAPGYTEARLEGAEGSVTIESTDVSEDSHEQVDIICALPEGLEAGARLVLTYETDETYIFPWKREAVERPLWFAHVAPLAAAVAVDERRRWLELAWEKSHSFETVAGPASRLHLILPGRVHAGMEISLHGIFTDRFRNIPSARGIPSRIRLTIVDSGGERGLGTPRGRFEAPHRFRVPLGRVGVGLYRIRAWDAATGELLAQSNPMEVLAEDGEGLNVYWGEIHGHTEMSDGSGGFEEMFRHARDEGRQDFAAAADHACYFTDNEWQWMQDVVNSYNERGDFVAVLGYEWAGKQGHRCIYARGRRLDLFRGMCAGEDTLDVVYDHFHDDDNVVAGPHHTGANGRMEFHDPATERFIEIYSMWGASDRIGSPKAPLFPGTNPLPAHEWLNRGAKLGFTGGGDCHEGSSGWTPDDPDGQGTALHGFARQLRYRCGMTAALMPELRRRYLIDALQQRKTWATTGARILVDFEASGVPMGEEGEAEEIEVKARVHGVQPLRRLEIIRDGEVVWTEEVEGLDAELEWSDPEPVGERTTWMYLHVIQEDGEEAWSSPVWLNGGEKGRVKREKG